MWRGLVGGALEEAVAGIEVFLFGAAPLHVFPLIGIHARLCGWIGRARKQPISREARRESPPLPTHPGVFQAVSLCGFEWLERRRLFSEPRTQQKTARKKLQFDIHGTLFSFFLRTF